MTKAARIISALVSFVNRGLRTCYANGVSTLFVIQSAAENLAIPANCRTVRYVFPCNRSQGKPEPDPAFLSVLNAGEGKRGT